MGTESCSSSTGGDVPVFGSRLISALEVLAGAAVVVGHNVLRAVPNEVPILVIAGLVSVRPREGTWSAMGFPRPASWGRVARFALAAAALRIALGEFVSVRSRGNSGPRRLRRSAQARSPGTSATRCSR